MTMCEGKERVASNRSWRLIAGLLPPERVDDGWYGCNDKHRSSVGQAARPGVSLRPRSSRCASGDEK